MYPSKAMSFEGPLRKQRTHILNDADPELKDSPDVSLHNDFQGCDVLQIRKRATDAFGYKLR